MRRRTKLVKRSSYLKLHVIKFDEHYPWTITFKYDLGLITIKHSQYLSSIIFVNLAPIGNYLQNCSCRSIIKCSIIIGFTPKDI